MIISIFDLVVTLFTFALINPISTSASTSLSDVTGELLDGQVVDGFISAFGDLNGDRATDVFLLSNDGKSVDVLKAKLDINLRGNEIEFVKEEFIKESGSFITSVVPADFNSDSQMDILITKKPLGGDDSSNIQVEIYSGNKPNEQPFVILTETLKDQPIVIDWNGDMIPDLFGELNNGSRAVWIFNNNGSYIVKMVKNGSQSDLPPLRSPQSSAFLDLDGDMTADLCVVSEEDGRTNFEFWINKEGKLTWTKSVPAPTELKFMGQASFVDLDGDHQVDIVLPGCLDEDCTQPAVFVWTWNKYLGETSQGKWHHMHVNFKPSEDHSATFDKTSHPRTELALPLALRMGDFNLDGLPDAIVVLKETKDGVTNSSVFLMMNEGCNGDQCDGFSRSLFIDYANRLHKDKPLLATFFDFMENGALDILITEVTQDNRIVVRAIKQDFSGDASFLKVLVTGGLCSKDCPNGHTPYGVNQAGPTAKFEMVNSEGGDQMGVAFQLSQSAYFSLQLPFMLFGLGRTPNFVDQLEVAIPYPTGEKPRLHKWTTLIPNSHVIVITNPPDDPSSWSHELYINPSRLVLLTGISLLGTCAFIAVIVGILQWRERIEDKKEKLQESQRFHFDAM